jgi:hypothetical protein
LSVDFRGVETEAQGLRREKQDGMLNVLDSSLRASAGTWAAMLAKKGVLIEQSKLAVDEKPEVKEIVGGRVNGVDYTKWDV